jgi:LacI family xylobiose transport system transcriptional regulator
VSKVLNGRAGVGEETRRRVEALLRDHGYRRPTPLEYTRSLQLVFHGMLGSIAIEIMRGVEEVARTRDLLVGFTDVTPQLAAGTPWVEPMLLRRPTAVIAVSSSLTADHGELLKANGIPLVSVDPTGDVYPMPTVGSTNWSGGLAATRHLLDLGHRRIGLLTGPPKDLSARARVDGFRAALDNAGVPFDESLVRTGTFLVSQGLELGLELLRLRQPPTAIVCGNDLQAMGVYQAALKAGRRIPDDLSVVGFDDIDQASWLAPPLTTVRQPFWEMGAAAARLALALAGGETPAETRYEVGTTLIVRESTAPRRG